MNKESCFHKNHVNTVKKITYGLSGDTSGDDNDFRALKSLLETIVLRSETSNLIERSL
jgi:hypothetical protein